jgi:hypothetical protein
MRDRFYTPPDVAAAVADAVIGETNISSAVDFAIGAGALMEQLALRCPAARVAGADIDAGAVQRLRQERPEWSVSRCDFLSLRSRQSAKVTQANRKYDAIALNPPFSHRGGATARIKLSSEVISCSPAAAFLGLSTGFTHQGSRIAALIPTGSMTSEKDSQFWDLLKREWAVEGIEEFGRGWLPGTNTAVALVTLARLGAALEGSALEQPEMNSDEALVRVIRGCTPMFKTRRKARGRLFIHTTGLQRDGIQSTRVQPVAGRQIRGPSVLLPRVGQPVSWKVLVYSGAAPLQLSDCVIALECESLDKARWVEARIKSEWQYFRTAWTGSCAPYVTVGRLETFLNRVGIGVARAGTPK